MKFFIPILILSFCFCLPVNAQQTITVPDDIFIKYPNPYNLEEEIRWGNELEAQFERESARYYGRKHNFVNTPSIKNYTDKLIERLTNSLSSQLKPLRLKFRILDYSNRECFSYADQHIYISLGTLKHCPNSHVLAWIVAHEISHTVLRHGIIARAKIEDGIKRVKKEIDETAGFGVLISEQQLIFYYTQSTDWIKFSREIEMLADRLSIRLMMAAGFDPLEVVRFFINRKSIDKDTYDHPSDGDRIITFTTELVSYYRENPDWESKLENLNDFQNFQKAVSGLLFVQAFKRPY